MILDQAVKIIMDTLEVEHTQAAITGKDDVAMHRARRSSIKEQFQAIETHLEKLREQVRALPALPPMAPILWAQSVRAMPNLVFLEVDTTGLYEHAEIIRVAVVDGQGKVLIDRYAQPTRPLTEKIMQITGITNTEIQRSGMPLQEVIEQLRSVLQGTYLLSYTLDFDRGKLDEATRQLALDSLIILGEDLMLQAMHFFICTSYPKLEDLCERVGHPLPKRPHQSALDRARGQRAVLHAIADVITGPPALSQEEVPDDDLDTHPF